MFLRLCVRAPRILISSIDLPIGAHSSRRYYPSHFCIRVAQRFYIIFAGGAAMKYNWVFYLSDGQTC
jgi:hypothetical protein